MMNLIGPHGAFQTQFPTQSPELLKLREEGALKFQKCGLPSRQDEDWHYTSVKGLVEKTFELALKQPFAVFSPQDIKHLRSDFINVVFVNGQYSADLSDDFLADFQVKKYLIFIHDSKEFILDHSSSAFGALNEAYAEQGFSLNIPANTVLDKPLQILSYVTGDSSMTHPRFQIVVGERSKLVLVESYSGSGRQYFQNTFSTIEVGDSAKMEYIRIQDDSLTSFNIGKTEIQLGKDSSLEALSFCVGSKLGRHELYLKMTKPGATAAVNGITLGSDDQHLDHSTLIDHIHGECSSAQLYKSVLADKARSVFTGKVIIQKGAQKASSEQLNNNLLLSREAEADSRPQLEILADDVKATHGSTVGQLDEDELFYLISRAIPRSEAIEMLSLGYLQELVYKVANLSVQTFLGDLLVEAYRRRGTL